MLMCCVTTMFVVVCLFLNPAITMLRVWGFHIELWVCDDGVCRNAGSVSRHGLEFFCRRSLRRRRRRRRPLQSPREAEGFLLKGCGRWGAGRRDRVCCPRGAEGARRWGCATDMHATKVGGLEVFISCSSSVHAAWCLYILWIHVYAFSKYIIVVCCIFQENILYYTCWAAYTFTFKISMAKYLFPFAMIVKYAVHVWQQ